jgi:hypothetical protein
LQSIQSVVRNRFVILPGLLSVACFAAALALPPLAAQEAKPDASQPAQVASAAAESAPAQQTAPEPSQQVNPPAERSASERLFVINWDAQIKYSAGVRLTGQNNKLIDPAVNQSNTNLDDGDRAFNRGLMADRGDIFTEVDMTYGNVGIHASAAGWGDAAYLGNSADNSPATFNAYSVNYNQWTEGTRSTVLGDEELLDAFAFGKFNIGKSTLSVRGGQYALQWGESLFFGNNGIAGGMSPVDALQFLTDPTTQFKELILPVPQGSMQWQLTPKVAVGAYYQFRWVPTRLAPVGSFFSDADIIGAGDERLIAGAPIQLGETACGQPGAVCTGPLAFWHSQDRQPKNYGQFGAQVKMRLPGGWDAGIYGIQYHEKVGWPYLQPFCPTGVSCPNQSTAQFMAGQIGNYYWAYPENVKAVAVSATKTHGAFNYAAEFGAHFNQDLVSDAGTDASVVSFGHVPKPDANSNPLYAVGKSINGNVNWLASLGPSFVSKEASWVGEIAWNMLESVDKNPLSVSPDGVHYFAALDPNTRKHAVGIRSTYEPTWRQILPGVDLSIPVGASFYPTARSAVVFPFGYDKGGDFSGGAAISYLDHWRFGATLTGYYGPVGSFLNANQNYNMKQDLADRYNVRFTLSRTIGFNYKSHAK